MILKYDISTIDHGNRGFFIEMLPYVSEKISGHKLANDYIEIFYDENSYTPEIQSKLDKLKVLSQEQKIENIDHIKPKILFDRSHIKTANQNPIFDKLIKNGDIYEIGYGTYAYSGLFLKVFDYFYNKIKELGQCLFNAREYKFPVLFPLDSFQQGGYFESFPHHIMFQTNINNDIEILEQFSKKGITKELLKNMKTPQNVLTNAACGPIYPMLSGKTIKVKKLPLVYFLVGKCFRNESNNVFELARMNEFTMSELVVLGTEKEVQTTITKAQDIWNYWMQKFNFNCKIETANDSFFASNYKKLKFFQLLGNSKQELQLLLPHLDQYIAASSANFHRTHFAKRYNIKTEGGYCHSGCIAFGIERLAYAFLCQHGCIAENWDIKVKKEIEQYTSETSYYPEPIN